MLPGQLPGNRRHTNEGSDFPIFRKYRARTFWMEMRFKKKKEKKGSELRGDRDIYLPFLGSIEVPTRTS